ncbi:MAG: hypothetical protein Unbinned1469contig1000_42 [Prokaryotic dsDNA virus sp.]|jgi:hypothetical protein|nr:MAG: hypothetical protein Unbinned1469contig1000_42 [Prokaryotic dsDNA virus sp.]|tara:strand:+ start:5121 stop:5576 length:456 start_codon:yes stop_codon:yes gene_type:complete
MKQLIALAKVFPKDFIKQIKKAHGEEDYLPFGTIAQRLLEVCGNYDWSIKEIVYEPNGQVSGCIGELSVVVDNQVYAVQGTGSANTINTKDNNGDLLKKAESDAFKRCARNLGLGLHLWTGSNPYWLEKTLMAKNTDTEIPAQIKPTGTAT